MLRRLRNETILIGSMLAAVVGLSVLGYVLFNALTPDPAGSPSGGASSAMQEPGRYPWQPTGEFRAERMGIGLSVHSYIVNKEYMAILYSVDASERGVDASPVTVALTDDLGQSYDVASNAVLGSTLGVTAALLIVEPYKGEGKTFTLTLTDMTTSSGAGAPSETAPGVWSVTFIENREPGAAIDYTQGGRISPTVMSAGDLSMAMAGQPGGRFVKLLVDRGGQQGALYGWVYRGAARPLTEEEFHQQLKASTGEVDDYPSPRGWPAPADAP